MFNLMTWKLRWETIDTLENVQMPLDELRLERHLFVYFYQQCI